jgi:hypothetical protein
MQRKFFEPAGDCRYNQTLGETAGKDTIDENSYWRRPGRVQIQGNHKEVSYREGAYR